MKTFREYYSETQIELDAINNKSVVVSEETYNELVGNVGKKTKETIKKIKNIKLSDVKQGAKKAGRVAKGVGSFLKTKEGLKLVAKTTAPLAIVTTTALMGGPAAFVGGAVGTGMAAWRRGKSIRQHFKKTLEDAEWELLHRDGPVTEDIINGLTTKDVERSPAQKFPELVAKNESLEWDEKNEGQVPKGAMARLSRIAGPLDVVSMFIGTSSMYYNAGLFEIAKHFLGFDSTAVAGGGADAAQQIATAAKEKTKAVTNVAKGVAKSMVDPNNPYGSGYQAHGQGAASGVIDAKQTILNAQNGTLDPELSQKFASDINVAVKNGSLAKALCKTPEQYELMGPEYQRAIETTWEALNQDGLTASEFVKLEKLLNTLADGKGVDYKMGTASLAFIEILEKGGYNSEVAQNFNLAKFPESFEFSIPDSFYSEQIWDEKLGVLSRIFGTDAGIGAAKKATISLVVDKALEQINSKKTSPASEKDLRDAKEIIMNKFSKDIADLDNYKEMYKTLMKKCGYEEGTQDTIDWDRVIEERKNGTKKAIEKIEQAATEGKIPPAEQQEQRREQQQAEAVASATFFEKLKKVVLELDFKKKGIDPKEALKTVDEVQKEKVQTFVQQKQQESAAFADIAKNLQAVSKDIEGLGKEPATDVVKKPVEKESDSFIDKTTGKKIRTRINSFNRGKISGALKGALKTIAGTLLSDYGNLLKQIGVTDNSITIGLTRDGALFFTEALTATPQMTGTETASNMKQVEQEPTPQKPVAQKPTPTASTGPQKTTVGYGAVTNVSIVLDRDKTTRNIILRQKGALKRIATVISRKLTVLAKNYPQVKKELQESGLGTFDDKGNFSMSGRTVVFISSGKTRKREVGSDGEYVKDSKKPKKYILMENIFDDQKEYIVGNIYEGEIE